MDSQAHIGSPLNSPIDRLTTVSAIAQVSVAAETLKKQLLAVKEKAAELQQERVDSDSIIRLMPDRHRPHITVNSLLQLCSFNRIGWSLQ